MLVSVVIDSFSKHGCKIPCGSESNQSIKHSLETIFFSPKRKPSLIEKDDSKLLTTKFFTTFPKIEQFKRDSKCNSTGAIFSQIQNSATLDRSISSGCIIVKG